MTRPTSEQVSVTISKHRDRDEEVTFPGKMRFQWGSLLGDGSHSVTIRIDEIGSERRIVTLNIPTEEVMRLKEFLRTKL